MTYTTQSACRGSTLELILYKCEVAMVIEAWYICYFWARSSNVWNFSQIMYCSMRQLSVVFISKTYKSRQKRVWFASPLLALIHTIWWWYKHIATDWEEETLKVDVKEGESVWLQGTWVLHIQSFLSAQLTKQRLNTELRQGHMEL